ncbi:hypothetical protein Ciccas_003505 [Cichlidogyrus casuarinus]|uniref:Uncharacterized protein n=1 Tax=Cichlidogyrus casuarinus TaxID=1844966 RepID=A0ABD2QE64_9PLAT
MHKAHLHSHHVESTPSQHHHHKHKLDSKQSEEFSGLKRQNSLKLRDQQQIRPYADFRSVSKSANSLTEESKLSQSLPLVPRSLDLAEELNLDMGSPTGQNLSQLCVTISSTMSPSLGPCSGDTFDPPARVSSGVPTDLMDMAFQMDDSMMHTPVAGTTDPTLPVDSCICAADRSPLTLLTSVISPSATTPSKE